MTQAPDRARGALVDSAGPLAEPAGPLADPAGVQADPAEVLIDPAGALADLVAAGDVVILSGAGLSTESGIPDYRGPTGLARRAEPMTYQTFTGGAAARRRYWARSHLGWRHIAGAVPNAGHRAVAELQRRGLLAGIITQNVDGLHQAAGARQVIELHGSLYRVVCLGCGQRTSRAALDTAAARGEPRLGRDGRRSSTRTATPCSPTKRRPRFAIVDCQDCGGLLKPDVVFFGENVPAAARRGVLRADRAAPAPCSCLGPR